MHATGSAGSSTTDVVFVQLQLQVLSPISSGRIRLGGCTSARHGTNALATFLERFGCAVLGALVGELRALRPAAQNLELRERLRVAGVAGACQQDGLPQHHRPMRRADSSLIVVGGVEIAFSKRDWPTRARGGDGEFQGIVELLYGLG